MSINRPTDRQTARKKERTDMVYFRKAQAANNKLLRLFYEFKLYENGTYDFFINDYISHDI